MEFRVKVDENLPAQVAGFFRETGHEARTVAQQGAQGTSDDLLVAMCRKHHEVLLTLDTDFANITLYPPFTHDGIIVLRLTRQDREHVLRILELAMPELNAMDLDGRLVIVEENRIRVHPAD